MNDEIDLSPKKKEIVRHDALIIDDDKDVRDVLVLYCENLGVFRTIITATDGADASKKMSNQKFTLILMDINMPKKSGIHLLKEFDSVNRNSLEDVVIVSGELDKTKLTKAMEAGIRHFLIKPFDEAAFQEKALKVLKKPRVNTRPR